MKLYSKKMHLCILFIFCSITNFLWSEAEKISPAEIQNYLSMQQNRSTSGATIPLKGLSKIIYFTMIPASDKAKSDKINLIVVNELKKFGKVNLSDIIVKTEDGKKAIDLSGFTEGVTLIYEIRDLFSLDGEKLNVVRASLNLETRVDILKTKETSSSYIWSNNCFFKGSTEKKLEKLVSESLEYLMQDFFKNYSAMNSEKPTFNLYTP